MPEDGTDALRRFYEAEEVYVSPEGDDFSVMAKTLHPSAPCFNRTRFPTEANGEATKGTRGG